MAKWSLWQWVLKYTLVILSRNRKIDPDTRWLVYYSKEESVRKVKAYLDMEALQQDINVLKTLYKKQERLREHHKKSIQGALDSIKTLIHSQGQTLVLLTKEIGGFPIRYGQGPPQIKPPRPLRILWLSKMAKSLFNVSFSFLLLLR